MGEWISVEDELPKKWQKVLAFEKWGDMKDFDYDTNTVVFDGESFGGDTTHWMLLPEPPK